MKKNTKALKKATKDLVISLFETGIAFTLNLYSFGILICMLFSRIDYIRCLEIGDQHTMDQILVERIQFGNQGGLITFIYNLPTVFKVLLLIINIIYISYVIYEVYESYLFIKEVTHKTSLAN